MLFRSDRRAGDVSREPATVRVLDATDPETVPRSGAVQSVQEAEVRLPRQRLEQLWKAETLERLARAYWAYVSRLFLSLVRVVYGPESTTVVLLSRRIPLLRLRSPAYEVADDGSGGSVTWPIERGLLVAKEGRSQGHLRIRVQQIPDPDPDLEPGCEKLLVRVAIRNFYPWLRGSGSFSRFGSWLYARTQLTLHVIVCNGFLRSLARLEFPEPPAPADATSESAGAR